MARHPSERTVIFLIGAVQFVNILDFMMVLPLGPFFAGPLGIPASRIGVVGGSYTAAAALSGIACSFFLDRFDRRKALGVAVAGLVAATALGGFSTGFAWMISARVLAGLFGGPATSLSLSIVADVIPAERRGKALGAVMGAFSVAAVLGVPTGLELARWGGWRLPFFSVAGMGLVLLPIAIFLTVAFLAFVRYDPRIPIGALFVLFMVGMNFRMAPYQTLISKVPAPQERAGFMSLMGAVQHLSASVGAVSSSLVLTTGAAGELIGIPVLGTIAMAVAALVPALFWSVERRVAQPAPVPAVTVAA